MWVSELTVYAARAKGHSLGGEEWRCPWISCSVVVPLPSPVRAGGVCSVSSCMVPSPAGFPSARLPAPQSLSSSQEAWFREGGFVHMT